MWILSRSLCASTVSGPDKGVGFENLLESWQHDREASIDDAEQWFKNTPVDNVCDGVGEIESNKSLDRDDTKYRNYQYTALVLAAISLRVRHCLGVRTELTGPQD